ncbi:MFS transporter, partial [Streptomyces sp. NPDC001123]
MPSPASPPSSEPPDTGTRHITATIVLACLGVFVSYLPVVGVSVALPVVQQALDASTEGFQWITDAFILPTAALLLTCGMVGDLYGRKKTYLAGLALFCLGCVVCLTAGSVVHAPRRRHRRRRRTPPGPRADVLTYSGERPATVRGPAALH